MFKTNKYIFITYGNESFNPNWMDSDKIIVPPNTPWDYKRELQIEDVSLWEVLAENGGGNGFFAAWDPYAEFYMVLDRWNIEVFYGPKAQERAVKAASLTSLTLPVSTKKWVAPEDMWLFI